MYASVAAGRCGVSYAVTQIQLSFPTIALPLLPPPIALPAGFSVEARTGCGGVGTGGRIDGPTRFGEGEVYGMRGPLRKMAVR